MSGEKCTLFVKFAKPLKNIQTLPFLINSKEIIIIFVLTIVNHHSGEKNQIYFMKDIKGILSHRKLGKLFLIEIMGGVTNVVAKMIFNLTISYQLVRAVQQQLKILKFCVKHVICQNQTRLNNLIIDELASLQAITLQTFQ